jgi:predicted PurR-regulated permease PerM
MARTEQDAGDRLTPPPMTDEGPITRSQKRILGGLALAAIAVFVWIALPVGTGLVFGVLTAFVLAPLYSRLAEKTGRPVLSAVICALGSTLIIAGAILTLAWVVVQRGADASESIGRALSPGGELAGWAAAVDHRMAPLGLHTADLVGKARNAVGGIASRVLTAAAAVADATARGALTLFFLALTIFFVLRHWRTLIVRAERVLPLHPRHTRKLLAEFRKTGREVLLGTVLTGVVQGAAAAIGYAITGLPQPVLLGALTAVASLIPAVGTLLVWVPAGLYLIFSGHPARGIVELAFAAVFVIGISDYIVRPHVLGKNDQMPALLTFIALFGGIEVFGVAGLVLGPVVVSFAIAVVTTYEQEMLGGGPPDARAKAIEPPLTVRPLSEPDDPGLRARSSHV